MCVGFPTGWDSATFWDKGTEVPSLSREKGRTGQAQNLATGRDGRDSLSKSLTGHGTGQSLFFCQNPGQDARGDFPMTSCFRTPFPVLKRTFPVLEHPFLF